MALGIAPDQVLLADAATGRELARLTTLQPVTPTPLVFSPDDTKLIARTNEKTVLVWDLWQIRDQLSPRGLDWDAPPYPTGPASRNALGPLAPPRAVRVVGEVIEQLARRAGELVEMNRRLAAQPDDSEALVHRGWLFTQQKTWTEAIADFESLPRLRPGDSDACWLLGEAYEEAGKLAGAMVAYSRLLERDPENHEARFQIREALGDHEQARSAREKASSLLPKEPLALNNRAWQAVTGPLAQRDPERAVALARRAVAQAPGLGTYLNTLGVALYRARQYAEAILVLERSRSESHGEGAAFDLFFLAMAHRKLGHASQARSRFDRAVRWWGEQKNLLAFWVSDLVGFRAEAEAVLAGPGADLPADVFAKPR